MAARKLPSWAEVKVKLDAAPTVEPRPQDCSICSMAFGAGTERPVDIGCKGHHIFGSDCIMTWFTSGEGGKQPNTCPLCREELFELTVPRAVAVDGYYLDFNAWQEDTLESFAEFDFPEILRTFDLLRLTPREVENVVALLGLRDMVNLVSNALESQVCNWEEANNLLYTLQDFQPTARAPEEGESELTWEEIVAIQNEYGRLWTEAHHIWSTMGPFWPVEGGPAPAEGDAMERQPDASAPIPGTFPEPQTNGDENSMDTQPDAPEPLLGAPREPQPFSGALNPQEPEVDEMSPSAPYAFQRLATILSAEDPTTALIDRVHRLKHFLLHEEYDELMESFRFDAILLAADIIAHKAALRLRSFPRPDYLDDDMRYNGKLMVELFRTARGDDCMRRAMLNHPYCRSHPDDAAHILYRMYFGVERAIGDATLNGRTTPPHGVMRRFPYDLPMSDLRYPSKIYESITCIALEVLHEETGWTGTQACDRWIDHMFKYVQLIALVVAARSVVANI